MDVPSKPKQLELQKKQSSRVVTARCRLQLAKLMATESYVATTILFKLEGGTTARLLSIELGDNGYKFNGVHNDTLYVWDIDGNPVSVSGASDTPREELVISQVIDTRQWFTVGQTFFVDNVEYGIQSLLYDEHGRLDELQVINKNGLCGPFCVNRMPHNLQFPRAAPYWFDDGGCVSVCDPVYYLPGSRQELSYVQRGACGSMLLPISWWQVGHDLLTSWAPFLCNNDLLLDADGNELCKVHSHTPDLVSFWDLTQRYGMPVAEVGRVMRGMYPAATKRLGRLCVGAVVELYSGERAEITSVDFTKFPFHSIDTGYPNTKFHYNGRQRLIGEHERDIARVVSRPQG